MTAREHDADDVVWPEPSPLTDWWDEVMEPEPAGHPIPEEGRSASGVTTPPDP